jgi:RNA polymerase sigma-70 factor (ECF subfamily)
MASRAQTTPLLSDEEVVRRFRETGDNAWFAELFARYRKKVYYACRAFYSDSAAAEDATQETFLRAYEKLGQFGGGDLGGWLMRIAKNICIDQWRKRRPEAVIDEADAGEDGAVDIAVAPTHDLRLSAERVWKEMQALSPEQRRCLEMKIEGYSYEETAQRTGMTVEAVKSHLQNGRRMLWLRMEGTLVRSK